MTYRNESAFTSALLKELRKIPRSKFWRVNSGTARMRGSHVRMGEPGTPDICGFVGPNGRFVGIETKTERGAVSDEQEAWHKEAIELGAVVVVARPDDFARVLQMVAMFASGI